MTALTVSPILSFISSALRLVMTLSIRASPTRMATWAMTPPSWISSIFPVSLLRADSAMHGKLAWAGRYGNSKIPRSQQTLNERGYPVCSSHKESSVICGISASISTPLLLFVVHLHVVGFYFGRVGAVPSTVVTVPSFETDTFGVPITLPAFFNVA